MPTLHLHHRRDSLLGLASAVTASIAVLGGVVALYAEPGRTPWVADDAALARAAQECRHAPSVSARHDCLRALAQRHGEDAPALARTTVEPPAP